ncbi:hypothetical protein NHP164001_00270 [Helicobacter trogontum]|uniref:Uncharacterized protein n=1 Tax=Helicobacter trogontum TaxID=50960 RepID=A0ABQ0D1E0_9HELI
MQVQKGEDFYISREMPEIWQSYLRTDYNQMQNELEEAERDHISTSDSIKALRIQIDNELESTLQELDELQAQLPEEQRASLFEQCADNALNAIVGHFGLGAALLDSKDGGNVNTTHNVRQDIYASDKERQRYDKRGDYDSKQYHSHETYKAIHKQQGQLKEQGKLDDYMTGQRLAPNTETDLDHKVSGKMIHDDRARVLAEVDGSALANTESNLAMTDRSLNRMKKDKSAQEFIKNRDERLQALERNEQKRGYLTESEKKEKAKLEKAKTINDEKFKAEYDEAKKDIDKAVDKAYYTSVKPYKEALVTGAKDAGKMALHSVIGIVLHDLIKGMMIEIKILFKEFGNESFKEIFTRFKDRLQTIWEDLKAKWKDIIAGSLESAILSFFSNILVFVINTIFTTLKKIVQIIRAGFNSLYQAIKILVKPPKDMPKDEVMREAAKVLVSGLISATTMLGAVAMTEMLEGLCPALKTVRLPFAENETILGAVALCLTAALGAILSTIAIYYIDEWASKNKENKLQLQIMGKSGEVVQLKTAQSYLVLGEAWQTTLQITQSTVNKIQDAQECITKSFKETQECLNDLDSAMAKLRAFRAQNN